MPQIQVTFEVDANGLLKVTAKDIDTGRENNVVIDKSDNSLSPQEIEKMIKEADIFAEEDKRTREKVDAKSALEGLIYSTENLLTDNKVVQALGDEDVAVVREACRSALAWLSDNSEASKDEVNQRKEDLENQIHPIMEKVYQNQQAKEEL